MNSRNTKFSLSAIYIIVFLESKKTNKQKKNQLKKQPETIKKKKNQVNKLEYIHQIKLRT